MKSLADVFVGIIVPFSTVIPLFIGIMYYRYADKAIRIILAFLVVSLTINTAGSIIASYNINNLPLLHLYTLLESALLFLFFGLSIRSETGRKLSRIFLFAFPVLCIVDLLFFHSIYQFNSYTRPVESILLVILAMTYISEQVGQERKTGAERAKFWIVLGLLLYFSASFFQFLFSNVLHVTAEKHIRLMIWNIHACFVLIMYILIAVGLLKLPNDR